MRKIFMTMAMAGARPRRVRFLGNGVERLMLIRRGPMTTSVISNCSSSSSISTSANTSTHDVFNVVPPLSGHSIFGGDRALKERGEQRLEGELLGAVDKYGILCGSAAALAHAARANANSPVLETHTAQGERVDRVEYDPSYAALMRGAFKGGVANISWQDPDREGGHVARAMLSLMHYQLESGTSCPLTMTHSGVPPLLASGNDFARQVGEKAARGSTYDARDIPVSEKSSATLGMSMTEKQGGSDVRANTTTARPCSASSSGNGEEFLLTGHKWFTSAPMSDAFLTLARIDGDEDLSCFLVPRWLPSGSKNDGLQFQRLKNKLGDRSNASSEVEYRDAFGILLGDKGRGVPTIIEMVSLTRLDCVLGSAGLQRQAAMRAFHHASHREAFGAPLIDQPIMQSVLADLAVESEANVAVAMRLASAFDAQYADSNQDEARFARLAVAISKYFVCKRSPAFIAEALECHGGNGYVEDSGMPRLFRQSPLNSIWEGSGNVICLDVLRALSKDAKAAALLFGEIDKARGRSASLDALSDGLQSEIRAGGGVSSLAHTRHFVDRMAIAFAASTLLEDADRGIGCDDVADVYIKSRIGGGCCGHVGSFPSSVDPAALTRIVSDSFPK